MVSGKDGGKDTLSMPLCIPEGKNKNGRNPECVRSGRGDGNHGAGPYVMKNFQVDISTTFCYYLYQNIFEIESEASFC